MKGTAILGIVIFVIGIDIANAQRRSYQPDWYANPPVNTEDTTYIKSIGSTLFEALGNAFYGLAYRQNSIESDEITIDDSYGDYAIFDIEGPYAVIKTNMAVNYLGFSLKGMEDYIIISEGPNTLNEVLIDCFDFKLEIEDDQSISLSRCTEAEVYNHPDLLSNENYSGNQSWNYNSYSALIDYIGFKDSIHLKYEYTTYNGAARYYVLVTLANEYIEFPEIDE